MGTMAIGSLTCTPPEPQVGESALLEAKPPEGQAFDADAAHAVRINGVVGTRRYVQFTRPGANTVIATSPNAAAVTISVDVKAVPADATLAKGAADGTHHLWNGIGLPLLQVGHLAQQPHKVGFGVGQQAKLPLQAGFDNLRSRSLYALPQLQLPAAGKQALYEWDFGNGSRLGTMSPVAHHDFSGTLDPLTEYQHFDVSVASEEKTVTRTLTICNLYAFLKRRNGILHPQGNPSGFAHRTAHGFAATMTVTNPEAAEITLTQRRIVPAYADTSHLAVPTAVVTLTPPVKLGAKGLVSVPVEVTFAEVPSGCVGFTVRFAGHGPNGEPVRLHAHFDLEPRQRAHLLDQAAQVPAVSHLTAAVNAAVRPGPHGMTLSQLREAGGAALAAFESARPVLSNVNHVIGVTQASTRLLSVASSAPPPNSILQRVRDVSKIDLTPHVTSGQGVPHAVPHAAPHTGGVAVGDVCDSDNLPSTVPDGFACQATSETQMVMTPGQFTNARKGDVVLAPGGNGLIGGLLTHVSYPQRYSHCGIMTRNHDEITHCTASDDRIQDYPVGSVVTDGPEPTHGFRPDVVRYAWPGVITQTVENAVTGEQVTDPESHKSYNFQDFNSSGEGATIAGSWQIIPPLAVSVDPMLETMEMRERLYKIADDAAAQAGKFHYRFFGYTDPTMTAPAPADAHWAAGTSPGVCSSFIWLMMKRNGVKLQGAGATVAATDLTPAQISAGAKVGPATPDGLFLYSAAERAVAAQWFHDALYDKVSGTVDDKAGILGGVVELATKIADHVSNEFLNAFTLDHVQTDDDNDTWKSTTDANAVSPDNIMLWNGPSAPTPGPYGYTEPLVYREPRYDTVTISRWRQVQVFGTVAGQVTLQGKPVAGARVQLYDGKFAGTDANGHYAIAGVPQGQYVAKAQKVGNDHSVMSASVPVNVNAASVTANIALSPPPDPYRMVVVDGTIDVHWTYHILLKVKDDRASKPFHEEHPLGPDSQTAQFTVDFAVHDAKASLTVKLTWRPDYSVGVSYAFSLHDHNTGKDFILAKDASQNWKSDISRDNDDAHANFTIRNTLHQA